jgi:hypothetical protein
MIDPFTCTPADVGRRLVYRNAEHAGPPEYAIFVDCDHRFIHIRLVGDAGITKARPSEVTWPE